VTRPIAPVVVAAALALTACSGHRPRVSAAAGARGPTIVFAAVGASETVGEGTDNPVREAWPQVLFRTALPTSATFVNFGIPGVTVATALVGELPEVLQIHPNLVTVWLNVTDVLNGVPPATYETQLRSLVAQLRATGAEVLVANTPPVAALPVYAACAAPDTRPGACPDGVAQALPGAATIDATVDAYNAAIARVAKQEGAFVVDLHGAALHAQAAGLESSVISADGLDPSATGAALIAAQFAAALRTAGPVPTLRA
jgi:lysophospholipase L1-like esterase